MTWCAKVDRMTCLAQVRATAATEGLDVAAFCKIKNQACGVRSRPRTTSFKLPVFLKLTNTDPFAAWFVVTRCAARSLAPEPPPSFADVTVESPRLSYTGLYPQTPRLYTPVASHCFIITLFPPLERRANNAQGLKDCGLKVKPLT